MSDNKIPRDIYSTAQIREIENRAIGQGLSASLLMKRAGASALATIQDNWPRAKTLTIICGAGNNGGDGFDLARLATLSGFNVQVMQIGNSRTDTAIAARAAFIQSGGTVNTFAGDIPPCDLLIDALFGTGLSRQVSGVYYEVIAQINQLVETPVLALDIPSGLEADTGVVCGVAVIATVTISFIGFTIGLMTAQGPNFCGRLCLDRLGVPQLLFERCSPQIEHITLADYHSLLKPRQRSSHKGDFGHTLVIGGQKGYSGAVRIAAETAARTGSGLISIATASEHAKVLNLTRPELMCHGIEQRQDLVGLLTKASTVVVGPGLGQSDWAQSLFDEVLEHQQYKVVDADALNLLSRQPICREDWILTPHPGEAARLLNSSSQAVQRDRVSAVVAIQRRYGGVVILKGAGTLIYGGKGPVLISTAGNPSLASGGTGDALAGIIAGLLAQHHQTLQAACLGVLLHGYAADRAAKQDGERGLMALDLLPHLRYLINFEGE